MNTDVAVARTAKISIPEASLVILCGIAGCGKSTFAANHFLPTEIVSSDECRALVCDDATNQRVTGHAFELWRFIIRKRLHLQRTTVADATNLEQADRLWLRDTARFYNFFTLAVIFDLPLEICLSRNANRHRIVPEKALSRQYELFQAARKTIPGEGFDSVFVIDEYNQSLTEIEIL